MSTEINQNCVEDTVKEKREVNYKGHTLKEITTSVEVVEKVKEVVTEFNITDVVLGVVLSEPSHPRRRIFYDRKKGFTRTTDYAVDNALRNYDFLSNALKLPKDLLAINKKYGKSSALLYLGVAVKNTAKGAVEKLSDMVYN